MNFSIHIVNTVTLSESQIKEIMLLHKIALLIIQQMEKQKKEFYTT